MLQSRYIEQSAGDMAGAGRIAGESIASDNVFGDNSAAQQTAMTIAMTGDVTNGYTGTVTVGVAI